MGLRISIVSAFKKWTGVYAGMIAALLLVDPLLPKDARLEIGAWMSDIDFIVSKIESIHPKPWYRIAEEEFKGLASELKTDLSQLDEEQIIVRMMQLVAHLHDGHTFLLPAGHNKFEMWYPVRVERFADGYYITSVAAEHEHLLGARVHRVGDVGIQEAFERVASVASCASRFSWPRVVPSFFSNATILRALGIGESGVLRLEAQTLNHQRLEVRIPPVSWPTSFSWTRLGFQAPGGLDYVNVYDILSDRGVDVPLHLRRLGHANYWLKFLPEHKALYMQFNSVYDAPDESFAQFTDRLWKFYEEHSEGIGIFVLDMRYNDGGNGYILQPFIQGLIRHEGISQRGKLFCIVGPGTFSAATRCLGEMIEHTGVTVVGEATSGPLNWCSDYQGYRLPHSGLSLWVSTLCWQRGHPSDTRGYYPPDYAVAVKATDLFAGRDKALEAILAGEVRALNDILRIEGARAFLTEYETRLNKFSDIESWYPFTEYELRQLGLEMLQNERFDDALVALQLNTDRHPDSWRAWQNLADCYLEKGNREQAIQSYEKSLLLNSDNGYAQQQLRQLGLLQALAEGGWIRALMFYQKIRETNPRAFDENEINDLGYASLWAGRTEEAISIFLINTETHHESFSTWDSLAEAFMAQGNKEKAIQYYERSLELNPENTTAVEILEKLHE
jgi:tetratricopeptide (TPR) repeat protein